MDTNKYCLMECLDKFEVECLDEGVSEFLDNINWDVFYVDIRHSLDYFFEYFLPTPPLG